MGKQYLNFWKKVIAFDNLHFAFKNAARGKRTKPTVSHFEYHLEKNLIELNQELKSGAYQPGSYCNFYIHDPKKRLISASLFRDRVVHHALCHIIEPIFELKFIDDTYANRTGKGTHRALDRCTQYLRRFQYVLPLDIKRYFPSIDHEILIKMLSNTLLDPPVMRLCEKIIASGAGLLKTEYDMVYFPGDSLLAALRPRGLPIGNLTSQFWANVYLNGLDHFIKRTLKCRGYVRYVDDMLLFSDSKADLHLWREEIISFLAGLRLTLHENSAQPRPCNCGIPFLGFQIFQDYRRLKHRKVVHARRRILALYDQTIHGEVNKERLDASIQGWVNHARYGDTWRLREKLLSEIRL